MHPRHPVTLTPTARCSAALLLVLLLSGCWMDLARPGIEAMVEPAYNQYEILIPFFAWGDRNPARVVWRIDRFEPGTGWVTFHERETQTPNGYGGILSLGYLDEGRYRLEATILATRDRSYDRVPHQTRTADFWVDRTAPVFDVRYDVADPPEPIDGSGNDLVPPVGTQATFIAVIANPVGQPDPDFDSPESLLVVRAVSGDPGRPIRPPVPGQDEYTLEDGDKVRLWNANELAPGTEVTIIMVVVDAAGNRSDTIIRTIQVAP